MVMDIIHKGFSTYVGHIWEKICHDFVSGNEIGGIVYGPASRWWGGIPKEDGSGEYEQVEIDLVAESLDGKHLLVGECKWRESTDVRSVYDALVNKSRRLPFVGKRQKMHTALFLKLENKDSTDIPCYYPENIIESIRINEEGR